MVSYSDDNQGPVLRHPEALACEDEKEEGTPSCSTGPLGRLAWTLGELASLVQRRKEQDAS